MDEILAFEMSAAGAALPLAPDAPVLSKAACDFLRPVHVLDEAGAVKSILVPEERSLTIFLDGREIVTLMTLGGAPELMVLGFLLNQNLINRAASLASIDVDWGVGVAQVLTRDAVRDATVEAGGGKVAQGKPTAATGTGRGSVYANLLQQIAAVRLPAVDESRVNRQTLLSLLETMRQHDAIHRNAGSVHSCALFRGADLLVCVEDVGRHNGVDTITGWMALRDCPGGDKILFSTGRLTSEMVMKTAASGIPIAVSRNGISAMGYDLAASAGMTLFGRAAKQRFICYVGEARFDRC
jgi:FdhD protein